MVLAEPVWSGFITDARLEFVCQRNFLQIMSYLLLNKVLSFQHPLVNSIKVLDEHENTARSIVQLILLLLLCLSIVVRNQDVFTRLAVLHCLLLLVIGLILFIRRTVKQIAILLWLGLCTQQQRILFLVTLS